MKVEVGESLMYSYLSHIKGCQIVQMNWKISSSWEKYNVDSVERFIEKSRAFFENKYGCDIFNKVTKVSQILKQCECDVVGFCSKNGKNTYYAVDVAFHEKGLNYKSKDETAARISAKIIKAAMCLYECFDAKSAEIIFASPKITPAFMQKILPYINDVNCLFQENGFGFKAEVIANEEFKSQILEPILKESEHIADTSELFVRSYQLLKLFDK